jgi:hypothetical protein
MSMPPLSLVLRWREPALDFLDVKSSNLQGTGNPTLLNIAASNSSPGVFVIPDWPGAIGGVIEQSMLFTPEKSVYIRVHPWLIQKRFGRRKHK